MTSTSKATISTTLGDIVMELFDEVTPEAVANFVGLATGTKPYEGLNGSGTTTGPYYDGCEIHYVVGDVLIQMGDPTGTGTGGPGYWFPDEIVPGLTFDRPWLVATAGKGPDSHGSMFFITIIEAEWLNGDYTIFGEVIDEASRELVARISAVPASQMRPIDPVIINTVTVT